VFGACAVTIRASWTGCGFCAFIIGIIRSSV
jgi:hypothetical protein